MSPLLAGILFVSNVVQAENHVINRQASAVVPLYAPAQVKEVRRIVGLLPTLRQIRHPLHLPTKVLPRLVINTQQSLIDRNPSLSGKGTCVDTIVHGTRRRPICHLQNTTPLGTRTGTHRERDNTQKQGEQRTCDK